MAEKERESRRMHEEAVRVGNHADKLKMIRARNLQKIEKKIRVLYKIIRIASKHALMMQLVLPDLDPCVFLVGDQALSYSYGELDPLDP